MEAHHPQISAFSVMKNTNLLHLRLQILPTFVYMQ